jgi:hypothetical protein
VQAREQARSALLGALAAALLGLALFWPSIVRGHLLEPTDAKHRLFLPFSCEHPAPPPLQNHRVVDGTVVYQPWRMYECERWQAGKAALWNPYVFGGHPQYANWMSCQLSPFNLVFAVLPCRLAHPLAVLLQLMVAAAGTALFTRSLGAGATGALVAALGFAYNGLHLEWLYHGWILSTFCWVPWALWRAEAALERPSAAASVGCGIFLGLSGLGGMLQIYVFVAVLMLLYGGLRAWAAERRAGPALRRLLGLAPAAVVGIAIAAPMWLPALEMWSLDIGGRAGEHWGRPFTLVGVLRQLPLLATFAVPWFGTPRTLNLTAPFGGSIGSAAYCGTLAAVAAVVALVTARRRLQVRIWGFVLGFAFLTVVATPLGHVLYQRFFVLCALAIAVLAAFGITELEEGAAPRAKRVLVAGAVAFGALLLALVAFRIGYAAERDRLLAWVAAKVSGTAASLPTSYYLEKVAFTFDDYLRPWSRWLGPPLALSFGGVAALAALRRRKAWSVAALAVAVHVAELATFARTVLVQVDPARYPDAPRTPSTDRMLAEAPPHRVLGISRASDLSGAPLVVPMATLLPYRLASLRGSESLWPRNAYSLFDGADAATPAGAALLAFLDVKHVVTAADDPLRVDGAELVLDDGCVRIQRLPVRAVRARVMFDWVVAPEGEPERAHVRALGAELWRKVVLTAPASFPVDPNAPSLEARLEAADDDRMVYRVETARPGMLVVSDTYYPGWVARVNGVVTPIRRVDWALRGIELPAGAARVELRFEPLVLRVGIWLAALAALAAAWVLGREARLVLPRNRPID